MNIAYYLERQAAANPERVAIRFEGQSITYAQLNRDATRLADALRLKGITQGDRVALFLPNIPEFVLTYYAAQKLGAVVVTINAIFKTEEVRYLLDDSGALVVFTTAELSAFVPADCAALRLRVSVDDGPLPDGWTALSDLLSLGSDRFASVERAPDDEAALLYSSGTTGFPKGIVLTQRNIRNNFHLSATCSDYRPGD